MVLKLTMTDVLWMGFVCFMLGFVFGTFLSDMFQRRVR